MKKNLVKKLTAMSLIGLMSFSTMVGCSKTDTAGSTKPSTSEGSQAAKDGKDKMVIAMLPKFKGENYFDACKLGAQEAADELGITLLYDGPSQDQATNQKQVDILEGWIAQEVDVIIVSPNDPTAIAPTLKKAQQSGIKVVSYDADADPEARDLFINQITPDAAGKGLLDGAAGDLKAKGYTADNPANIALVSGSGTDANQTAWENAIYTLLETPEYNFMKIQNKDTDVYYPGTDETKVNSECATLISRMGEGADKIQAAIALSSMSTPALGAQYQSAASKPDATKITLTGLATPNALKTYIKDETNPLNSGVLWNCMDLGYLAVQAGYQLANNTITTDSTSVQAGRLGEKEINNRECVLGDALVFDATNVDNFDY
ncbi:sugar ABC transporter substrate-binding protein [Sporanaerobium hydrogeniformans]|uniref:Sugar ABC transporter substrate-binding protein n=1 Tax=Sporanaerobium hydrogeniformans TaxID=3072179 RepID=A0AC61DAQ6_9FIRM|nr:autoinducer 2 ABC transporter substrate-binding protein [Sporanaerobium hydrogeniformans]PHV70305.1 sugar ABC transporter substrate-binding protein [Sporanaerobium hydrogeniformans]